MQAYLWDSLVTPINNLNTLTKDLTLNMLQATSMTSEYFLVAHCRQPVVKQTYPQIKCPYFIQIDLSGQITSLHHNMYIITT